MLREGSWLTAKRHPATPKHPAHGLVFGRLMTMGIAVLRTTTHRNDSWSEGSEDMNKISGLCTSDRFSSFAPSNLADARKNVRDRLLFS
jgi:hypothetical protein